MDFSEQLQIELYDFLKEPNVLDFLKIHVEGSSNLDDLSIDEIKLWTEFSNRIIKLIGKRIEEISKPYRKYYAVPDLVNEINEKLK